MITYSFLLSDSPTEAVSPMDAHTLSEPIRNLLNIPNKPPASGNALWVKEPNEYVKLREVSTEQDHIGNLPPQTVHTFMAEVVKKWPLKAALGFKDKKDIGFTMMNYEEYYDLITIVARAFLKLGLEKNHSVCILGFNSMEWFVSNFAAIFAGGLSSGIYTTNNSEACKHILIDCRAQILVVENDSQLKKILPFVSDLPLLKKIIMWKSSSSKPDEVMTWNELVEMGRNEGLEKLESRLKSQVPNQCCTLIYTSGTTGNPKGVMLSHDNLVWTTYWLQSYVQFNPAQERTLSYLPLSHIAAQICDLFLPMVVGATVYFCQPDALRGSLKETMVEVGPTRFLGVPRVYEKMHEKMKEVGETMSGLKKSISLWAKGVGYAGSVATLNDTKKPWNWFLANALVFRKAKNALGLNHCALMVSAAAPMTKVTLDFFMSLDMPIMEVYGMSESTGPQTINVPRDSRQQSVGKTPAGTLTKLINLDENQNGEVCMFGRNVFMGYLRAPDKTMETLTEDGWLRSGDLGKFDSNNFLFITGRLKELIITAGGENVAPIPIEDKIKEILPFVSYAMVIGDKLKFLSVLLTFKTMVNEETMEPLEELTPVSKRWCSDNGVKIQTLSEFFAQEHPTLNAAIEAGLNQVNELSVSRAAAVQKFLILPRDFSIPGGELGPTMKPRRPIIYKMYSAQIEKLYQ